MFHETIALTGALTITKNNELVIDTRNLVVTAGKGLVAGCLSGVSTPITKMSVGSGAVAAAAGDTTLGTVIDTNALTVSGGTLSGATVTYACTWLPGDGTGAITEAGLFSAADVMLARTQFAVVNKGADDTVTITWTVTIS